MALSVIGEQDKKKGPVSCTGIQTLALPSNWDDGVTGWATAAQ